MGWWLGPAGSVDGLATGSIDRISPESTRIAWLARRARKRQHVFSTGGRHKPSPPDVSRTGHHRSAQSSGTTSLASDSQVRAGVHTSTAEWATMHRVPGRCSSVGRAAVL
jgi:hypothetical protein